ncbi:MAG: PilN domain-containing protein [Gemmatimonadaceae bacterium]
MIQVNLLPGNSSRSPGRELNLGGMISRATAGIRDKFMMGAVVSVGTVVASVGLLFLSQSNLEASLLERERQAMQDSARYKVVLAAKDKAEATRDSLYQQVTLIKSIDDSRFLWPHLLEEISNALPQYTWLTTVAQTSAPPSSAFQDTVKRRRPNSADAAKNASPEEKKARAEAILAQAARATRFRIVGHTVDIQALTLFMKTLEASPFIQNVQLTRSDLVLVDTKEVTEFQLEAESQQPPPFLVRTVSFALGDK